MCLIHNITPDVVISNEWLKDIYSSNSDGIGFVGFEDGKLVAKKIVPKNQRRALKWFRQHVQGRTGWVHWRYRTHGDIDLENCHPYPVLTMAEDGCDMHLMHNGVMSDFDWTTDLRDVADGDGYSYSWGGRGKRVTGQDDTRSDTYHFIRALLLPLVKPSLGGHPSVIHNKAVQALIAARIGSGNKLVIADSTTESFVIINEQEFVSWGYYGLECSNTYAWSSSSHKFDKPAPKTIVTKGDPRLASVTPLGNSGWKFPAASVLNDRLEHDDESGELVLGGEAADPAFLFEEQYTEHCRDMYALYDDTVAVFPNLGAVFDGTAFIEYADMYGADVLRAMVDQLHDQKLSETQFADEISENMKL